MFICTRVVTCVEFQYWPEFSINQDLGESELELNKYLEGHGGVIDLEGLLDSGIYNRL